MLKSPVGPVPTISQSRARHLPTLCVCVCVCVGGGGGGGGVASRVRNNW